MYIYFYKPTANLCVFTQQQQHDDFTYLGKIKDGDAYQLLRMKAETLALVNDEIEEKLGIESNISNFQLFEDAHTEDVIRLFFKNQVEKNKQLQDIYAKTQL